MFLVNELFDIIIMLFFKFKVLMVVLCMMLFGVSYIVIV